MLVALLELFVFDGLYLCQEGFDGFQLFTEFFDPNVQVYFSVVLFFVQDFVKLDCLEWRDVQDLAHGILAQFADSSPI